MAMGPRRGLVFNIGSHVKTDASRAATYSKRKKGLLKKVKELSILCGVDVAVMCYHPQITGVPPLLWGQPSLNSVLSRYKGVAPEEREKRKLDNSTFLHNQVQKVTSDLHQLAEINRKRLTATETSVWDERLNSVGSEYLQQLAEQVLRKREEVMELLVSSHKSQVGQREIYLFKSGMPPSLICAPSSLLMVQDTHNKNLLVSTACNNLYKQPWGRTLALPQWDVAGAAVPIASLCMTLPFQSAPAAETVESESSVFSGPNSDPDLPNSDPDTPGSSSSLANLTDHHFMFPTLPKTLGEVDLVEDQFGPIDIAEHVDMDPTWFSTGMTTPPAISDASETLCSPADAGANSHVKGPGLPVDVFDIWFSNMAYRPTAPGAVE